MNFSFKSVLAGAALSAAFSAHAVERVGEWWVTMPGNVLKAMSSSERVCAERGLKQLDSNSAKAAASEFKRFSNEFLTTASEDVLAWASFFEAYSLDKARDRFKAIDLYSETIELYPDSLASCAALFFRARAEAANGHAQKALADYREITQREEFAAHPLCLVSHNAIASSELNLGRLDAARAEWEAVRAKKRELNRPEWDWASGCLSLLSALANPEGVIREKALSSAAPEKKREDLRAWRTWVWTEVMHCRAVPQAYFKVNLGGAKDVRSAQMAYLHKLSRKFVEIAGPVFRLTPGGDWEIDNIEFSMVNALEPKKSHAMVEKMAASLRKVQDKKIRSSRAKSFIEHLRDIGRSSEAKLLLDCIDDPIVRAWTAANIGWRTRDGEYIVEQMEIIEKSPDAAEVEKAKRSHARCCQEILRDYDAAIKLYESAPEPPRTLWYVAQCHRAAGRLQKAQMQLDEICSIFPDEAALAMLTKGDWYRDAGEKKQAIGCYRRILAHAEWKKSQAASQAHQRLEAFGIATGGAVVNEAH